ncbi:hypothetical protein BC941DRAFT_429108 [Chlamydoabsidia padenii]|nr:hypothetical protein BC941DRAFT_429108 [Chlamydoabsidia padenii]
MTHRQSYQQERPAPQNVMDARGSVVHYCKNGQFPQAEHAFAQLCDMIRFRARHSDNDNPWSKTKVNYSELQIDNFQKAISSLVRYAPTLQQSIDYGCFFLHQVPEPLRDEAVEITVTINLIYLLKKTGRQEEMKQALELAKTGVAFEYALPRTPQDNRAKHTFYQDSHSVFSDIAGPVLRHFGLDFSADKRSVVPKK